MIAFDPKIHHRRSIRLKGHDYAGDGTYFVTICAHRDAGNIFSPMPVREMIARIWKNMPQSPAVGAGLVSAQDRVSVQDPMSAQDRVSVQDPMSAQDPVSALAQEGTHEGCLERRGTNEGCPYVVMPDHVHALVQIRGGDVALGEVVGAFKSLVLHEYIKGVRAGQFPPFPGKIWHRNYYERIVRTPEAERNIAEYIRLNPWKLVQHATHEGQSFRMIGNPTLLGRDKISLLCSRNAPPDVLAAATKRARTAGPQHCFISGFHSPPEKAILAALLQSEARLICCPAWGIDEMRIPSEWLPALEANRMLILEMRDPAASLAAAEARNRFVLNCAEKHWLPHVSKGGMLDRLVP